MIPVSEERLAKAAIRTLLHADDMLVHKGILLYGPRKTMELTEDLVIVSNFIRKVLHPS